MKKKLEHISIVAAMSFIVIVFCIFMFWWLYPYPTSTQVQPYKVINKVVKQGDLLQYEMEYCKYTDTKAIVSRQFIDGIIYSVPESTALLNRGCGKLLNSIEVPKNLPPGDYYMKSIVTFEMNPIKTVVNEYKTEMFKVVE